MVMSVCTRASLTDMLSSRSGYRPKICSMLVCWFVDGSFVSSLFLRCFSVVVGLVVLCLLFVGCWLFVIFYLLFVCFLFVGCCLLFAVCFCSFFVVFFLFVVCFFC